MNVNKELSAIEALDLDAIKIKLVHPESGEGWTAERAGAAEREYRRFLYLARKHPDEQISPLLDVDTFWHHHILDTRKYAADCSQVFGYFLHHFPYLGLRGGSDEETRGQVGRHTRELYRQAFGESDATPAHAPGRALRTGSYCANLAAKPSYCAAAIDNASYCASPRVEPSYCAAAIDAASYCAAPGAELNARDAYCAAPPLRSSVMPSGQGATISACA